MKSSQDKKQFVFNGWFGFWIFMTVYILIEGAMYFNGHETFFWQHKTEEEKIIQQLKIERLLEELEQMRKDSMV